jgi:hypothetical protein
MSPCVREAGRTAAISAAFYYSVAIVRSRDSCVRKGLILSSLINPATYVARPRRCQSTKNAGILPAYRPESRPVVAQKAQPSGGLVKILAGRSVRPFFFGQPLRITCCVRG